MPLKIDVRCQKCGHMLFKKHIPGRRGAAEYGGVEISCSNCKTVNLVGIKEPPEGAPAARQDPIPYGERLPVNTKA